MMSLVLMCLFTESIKTSNSSRMEKGQFMAVQRERRKHTVV